MKLETANTMTPQQLLDYAVQKLVAQGQRCVDDFDKESCIYGDGRGNHCLIGWCLDENDPELMNHEGDVYSLVGEDDVPTPILENVHLFEVAQSFHDSNSRRLRQWRARELRDNFNIETSGAHWQQWIEMGEVQ